MSRTPSKLLSSRPTLSSWRLAPRSLFINIALIPLACISSLAQSGQTASNNEPTPFHRGANEWGLHSGWGISIAGGAGNRSYWMLAGRWGYTLTDELGSGPLRGNLQYGIEVIPVLVMRQSSTVYAAGFSPLQLRYNFIAIRRLVPYVEIGGSILGSTKPMPEHTSRLNFLTHGGVGLQLLHDQSRTFQIGMRYQHISNAGIAERNPGINSLYFFTGLSWWR
jgi:hypothetical protein